MERSEAIDILAEGRGDAISVATMQSASPWYEAGQSDGDHVDASACMGSASSLGLGLAKHGGWSIERRGARRQGWQLRLGGGGWCRGRGWACWCG